MVFQKYQVNAEGLFTKEQTREEGLMVMLATLGKVAHSWWELYDKQRHSIVFAGNILLYFLGLILTNVT